MTTGYWSQETYTSVHMYAHENDMGDIVDAEYFCSDYCHRQWCEDNGKEYGGWNGCHEVMAPQYCASCEGKI